MKCRARMGWWLSWRQNFDWIKYKFLLSKIFYPFLLILREIEFQLCLKIRYFSLWGKVLEFIGLYESAIQFHRKFDDQVIFHDHLGVIVWTVILRIKIRPFIYLLLTIDIVLLMIILLEWWCLRERFIRKILYLLDRLLPELSIRSEERV